MYSGLLPKGLSEAELSSDDSDACAGDLDGATGADVRECKQNANVNALISRETSPTQGETLEFVDSTRPSHSSNECLPGVSEEMWNKFKHLQKQKDDQRGELPSTKRKRKRRANKRKCSDPQHKESKQVEEVNAPEKHLEGLKQYFGINDRFEPPACSRPPPKSGLEKTIDSAIEAGDYEKAEELSDSLATRELGVKIKNAVDCRDFVQDQEIEASKAAQKRKKNLVWGFEAKRRWETKSNMGYM
ncbi:protein FAM204A [Alosa pseudoharengus]|uniref:protein FAM204A n=1 Tax=Alosa pseudoharengus TaxID=34774 RepID=UPI003F8999B5